MDVIFYLFCYIIYLFMFASFQWKKWYCPAIILRRLQSFERNDMAAGRFDTNCISPGTVFMRNFETALLEFIANNIEIHTNWRNCEIYVSGSNVRRQFSIEHLSIFYWKWKLCIGFGCQFVWLGSRWRITQNYRLHSIIETVKWLQTKWNPLHLQWRQWLFIAWHRNSWTLHFVHSRGRTRCFSHWTSYNAHLSSLKRRNDLKLILF